MTNIKRITADRPVLSDASVDLSDLDQPDASEQQVPVQAGLADLQQLLPDKGPILYESVTVFHTGRKTTAYRLQVQPRFSFSEAMNLGGKFAIGFWLVTVLISPVVACIGAVIWFFISASLGL